MRKAYVVRMIADLSAQKRVAVPTACPVKLPTGKDGAAKFGMSPLLSDRMIRFAGMQA